MRARTLLTSLAVCLVGAALAPAGVADDVVVSGTQVTPVRLTLRTTYILYYLDLHSGPDTERFSVQMTPPPFATAGGLPEGQSIDGPTDIALQGPGTIGDEVQTPTAITPCSNRPAAFHGYATGDASVDITLPSFANTVLAVRYNTGRRAPWVDSDFKLTFGLEPKLVGSYAPDSPFAGGATIGSPTTYTTTGPSVSGPTGAHIILQTSPAPHSASDPYAPTAIGAGQAVVISGRLLPRKAGRKIVLQWDLAGGALHRIATVKTAAGGRFGPTKWVPAGRGTYELWASYPTQPGGLVADGTSCPLRFAVG